MKLDTLEPISMNRSYMNPTTCRLYISDLYAQYASAYAHYDEATKILDILNYRTKVDELEQKICQFCEVQAAIKEFTEKQND